MERPIFPFSALVGQSAMKKGLLLNAINPRIGGILIRGEKGTAKSTAARAFSRLLPEIAVVADCSYNCASDDREPCEKCAERRARGEALPLRRRPVPLINLPVGATEDRVFGTLNLEQAIKFGERAFEPGLLAAANRGVLYVDEVNLLADHLVDGLLDAAAMGQNYVEREGISVRHPCQFILIGTMNPEEGDLRPQLLDRFALCVTVEGPRDPAERAEVVRRRIAFETDPEGFIARWQAEEERERARVQAARKLLPEVQVADEHLDLIARICAAFAIDGLRGDLALYKTAQTLAAYAGRHLVTASDIREAAELALLHRRRRQPFDDPDDDQGLLDQVFQETSEGLGEGASPSPTVANGGGSLASSLRPEEGHEVSYSPSSDCPDHDTEGSPNTEPSAPFPPSASFRVRRLTPEIRVTPSAAALGRRTTSVGDGQGRYARARVPSNGLKSLRDLAFDATLRAAAPRQLARQTVQPGDPLLRVTETDLRERVYERKIGNLILFAVDASGSMAARKRMVAVKGAVLSLLLDAYQKRDRVGLVAFRGTAAELILPPTNSALRAERVLRVLPTGGRTPLAQAFRLCAETLQHPSVTAQGYVSWLILVSDGRPNVPLREGDALADACRVAEQLRASGIRALVIDTEEGPVRLGLNRRIAAALGAEYLRLEELAADAIQTAVRRRVVFGGSGG